MDDLQSLVEDFSETMAKGPSAQGVQEFTCVDVQGGHFKHLTSLAKIVPILE